ncbi:2OG-Fe(II)-dependent halogenase WelO5 family protein [Pseudonocardia phyllosphaerae]|uniref:2OG-Fe(II)-dependent halogenase WelO5 family protein n=1 Tax=Pseudonocardia phyllosphaerae TaxID=3390502 RepID=UPI0039786B84
MESAADDFDIGIVENLLRDGHHDGAIAYVVRGAVPAAVCETVHANFRTIISVEGTQRALDDIIKADQVGATQFKKSGQEYALNTARLQVSMLSLFDGLSADETSRFMLDDELRTGFLARGLHFGPARFKSTYSNYCTIRAWLRNGEMSLQPHEDISQVEAARADEFEIQTTGQNTMSFNICVRSDGSGGAVRVWDLRPSPTTRRSLGLHDTGYPYPAEFVEDIPHTTIVLEPGDSYFLNASFLHGVEPVVGERITAGRFVGLSDDDHRVMFWT